MRIIPALDMIDGKCVRLEQGDFSRKKIYEQDPLDYAKSLEDEGFHYLHLVDLDGAKKGELVHWKILEKICHATGLKVDFGGGIKDSAAVKKVFDCGAHQLTAGSIAVKNPELVTEWMALFGAEKIILGADVKDQMIYIDGWKTNTGIPLLSFLKKFIEAGTQYAICTDISRDGLLQGSAVDLYQTIRKAFPDLNLIASGGVHSLDDIRLLEESGLEGAIVGKALLENKINFNQL